MEWHKVLPRIHLRSLSMMLTVAVSLIHSFTPSRLRMSCSDPGLNLSRTLSSNSRVISSLTLKSRTSVERLALLRLTNIGLSSSKSELPIEGKYWTTYKMY